MVFTIFRLVHAMANAMEQNPTAASKRPPFPTTKASGRDKQDSPGTVA